MLLLIGGCATVDDPDVPVGTQPASEPGMRLRVIDAHGQPAAAWSDKREVFIGLFGTVTEADIVDVDYSFVVIDPRGVVLSLDEPACRRFHVDAAGALVMIGAACHHPAAAGAVQLVPFADADVDDSGAMHFIVQIAPVDTSFDASSLKATFAVEAWPAS